MAFTTEDIMKRVKQRMDEYDDSLANNALACKLSELTGLQRVYALTFFLLISTFLIYVLFGADCVAALIGSLYPAYLTFQALIKEDSTQYPKLYTYWFVYAFFSLLDSLEPYISWVFPKYYSVKISVLLVFILPYVDLAQVVYDKFISKYIHAQEKTHTD